MNICSSLNLFYISMYLNCGLITNSIYIGPDRLAMPVMGNSYYFLLIIYSLLFSKIFHFLLVNLSWQITRKNPLFSKMTSFWMTREILPVIFKIVDSRLSGPSLVRYIYQKTTYHVCYGKFHLMFKYIIQFLVVLDWSLMIKFLTINATIRNNGGSMFFVFDDKIELKMICTMVQNPNHLFY